jgi:hypothetical protein
MPMAAADFSACCEPGNSIRAVLRWYPFLDSQPESPIPPLTAH